MVDAWSEAVATNSNNASNAISEAQRQRQKEITCWLSTLTLLTRTWHVLDAIFGASLTIYGIIILPSHLNVPIIVTLGLGIVLLLRAFAGYSGLNSDALHRFGLRMSGYYLSPLLGVVFLILSFLCMGKHAILVEYLKNHASLLHLSTRVIDFLERHHHALWIFFLSLAIMEVIRFFMIPILHAWLLQMDTSLGSPDVELLYTPGSAQKPWWWRASQPNNNNGLEDPLLPQHNNNGQPHWVRSSSHHYSMDHGNGSDASFWSRWFGSPSSKRDDDDDDESVDFASVQEEWASKSQEDPFWWSREESETPLRQEQQGDNSSGNAATGTNAKETSFVDGKNISWATEDDNER